jgi:hypothetical protein
VGGRALLECLYEGEQRCCSCSTATLVQASRV